MSNPWRRRVAVVALSLLLLLLAGACGDEADPADAVPPPKVPVGMVPTALSGGLTLTEDAKAREEFVKAGARALIADGRLWTIRQDGNKLVGTLQVSTLKSRVDLTDPAIQDQIVDSVLPAAKERIAVGGIPVVQSKVEDKVVSVWFGKRLFQVLVIKSSTLDADSMLADILSQETASPEWPGLPRLRAKED